MRYKQDKTGQLDKLYNRIMKKHFPELSVLEFVFVWRDKEKYQEGQLIMAETSKLTNRDRDLFGFDVRIETDESNWDLISSKEQRKTAYHELSHIVLEREKGSVESEEDDLAEREDDEENPIPQDIKYDKEGRVCFRLREHTMVMKRFEEELWEFGLSEDEDNMLRLLERIRDYHDSNKKEKQEAQEEQEQEKPKKKKKKKRSKKKEAREE